MMATPALLIFFAIGASTQAEAAPAPDTSAAAASPTPTPTTTATQAEPAVDVTSDSPPPSAWDKQRAGNGDSTDTSPAEQSLLGQVGRSLFGLLIVVGLIYILGKIAIAKLGKVGFGGRSGKNLRVVDRLQLDQRNALFMVQVEDGPLLLVGSGEKGVQLITELDGPTRENQSAGQSFSDAMIQAAKTEPGDESKPVDIAAKGTG